MIRDAHSKALIETDTIELHKYRREKRQEKDMQNLKVEIHQLKECINRLGIKIRELENKL
jgi:hypothetical protein